MKVLLPFIRKKTVAVSVCLLSGGLLAAGSVSDPIAVDLAPGEMSFWHTAPGHVVMLNLDFPHEAKSAELTVTGVKYSAAYRGLTDPQFELRLPMPSAANAENVYRLVLSFDEGTVRTAMVGVIGGSAVGSCATADVRLDPNDSSWTKFQAPRAVIPIPAGQPTFSVNGAIVDTGMNGDRGWYALGPTHGSTAWDLSLSADGRTAEETLHPMPLGMALFVR